MYQPKTISAKELTPDGKYVVYGANGIIGRYDKFNHADPQLLITCRGATCGTVNVSERNSWITGNAMVVRPKNGSIDMRFLEYLFRGGIDIQRAISGAAQPQITRTNLAPLEVAYPASVNEQKRIVGVLDEAFEGIAVAKAHAEKNLQNARALLDSHVESVFSECGTSCSSRAISEIATHSLGKMLDKSKNKGEFQPYLRNLNVRWFSFDLSDLLEMRFLKSEVERYTAVRGDVLVCEGGYPGRAAIWEEDEPVFFQKALHRVRFHEPAHSKWFVYFLYSQDRNGKLRENFSGTGIQHFTGEALARFRIPISSTARIRRELAAFDEMHETVRGLESLYQQKLASLDELKKSLLHQAFTGRL